MKTYPKLSETFILEEILGLERLGVPLHLYALSPPTDAISHGAVAKVRAQVSYVPEICAGNAGECLRRHLRALAAAPLRYLATLAEALPRGRQGLQDFLRAGWLADEMGRRGTGHLHSHFISRPADVADFLHRLTGRSYSISAHAKDIYLSAADSLRRKLTRARFTVTCTEYNRHHLAGIAPGAPIHRMYHGVDLERFHPRLRRPGGAVPLILAVGRLREKKGFATLVEACAELSAAGVPFRCEIIGYGEEEPRLQAQIHRAGLADHIRLTGKLTREQVIERYAEARVFVLPSQLAGDGDRDGIPNVLLEAMAMGLPVVSTRVSGIPELVKDGRNGLLVPPRDAAAVAQAIRKLLGDGHLAQRLGRAGRETVERHFNNEHNLALLRGLLESCNGPGPAPLGRGIEGGTVHGHG